jgi:polar amino acid transport system substrate-binding protein
MSKAIFSAGDVMGDGKLQPEAAANLSREKRRLLPMGGSRICGLFIPHVACISLALFATLSSWASEPPTIRLCQDSEDVYPWTLRSRPGLNNILLEIVAKKVGVQFEITSEPWKRCQENMKLGVVDGMFAISYLKERLEFGVYPTKGTEPDVSKNLMIDGYSLYRRRGDAGVNWDGKVLTASGPIGAQRGYSVSAQLQKLNANVDSGAYHVDDNFRKLVIGRIAAAALRTSEGDSVLFSNREFNGKVEKLPVPLVEKPYYLMFSKQYVADHGKQTQDIWNMIEKVRESPEYMVMENSFR